MGCEKGLSSYLVGEVRPWRVISTGLVLALWVVSLGCGPRRPPMRDLDGWSRPPIDDDPLAEGGDDTDPEDTPLMRLLREVSRSRGLAIRKPVQGRRVTRGQALSHVREKAENEMPRAVMVAQGELLRTLGVVPVDYDYVGGVYHLLSENLAGFYDQSEDALFLIDDIRDRAMRETVVHELVHALQDQHYDLEVLLGYRAGQSDALTASHALCEGDAMVASMEVMQGSPHQLRPEVLLGQMLDAVGGRSDPPPEILQRSLVMPYVDGMRFVQALHRRGGWRAVDAAYARLPASTEQLLHLDKYDADERPLEVADLKLLDGYTALERDTMGEQALRILVDQWAPGLAPRAAAGWGGDRYAVMESASKDAYAFALVVRMDTEADAVELEEAVHEPGTGALPPTTGKPVTCIERTDLGPLLLLRRGADLALVAGPYRATSPPQSASRCSEALAYAESLLGP